MTAARDADASAAYGPHKPRGTTRGYHAVAKPPNRRGRAKTLSRAPPWHSFDCYAIERNGRSSECASRLRIVRDCSCSRTTAGDEERQPVTDCEPQLPILSTRRATELRNKKGKPVEKEPRTKII